MSDAPLFAGSNQPARRGFGIDCVDIGGAQVVVSTHDVLSTPFYTLVEFARTDTDVKRKLLVVAPLSGHFPILLRDLIVALIPFFRVHVTDWKNVRHVGADEGAFGIDANISSVLHMMQQLGPGLTVIALCQAGVPTLAAAAALAAAHQERAPKTIVLVAVPVDPLANPTRVVKLLRSQPLSWFEQNLTEAVPDHFGGRGRRVYPARRQLAALWIYLARRLSEGSELLSQIVADDGEDAQRFPFLDAFTSIMDLDACFFVENTRSLFHNCDLRSGTLRLQGNAIDLRDLQCSRLLTIEGEWDDIAAPGQTSAAHRLCASLPERNCKSIVVPRCGHFALFHGAKWRRNVLPEILAFSGIH